MKMLLAGFAMAVSVRGVEVARNNNAIDGSVSVTLSTSATSSYRAAADHAEITPSLSIRCDQIGKKRYVKVIVETGALEPLFHANVGFLSSETIIREATQNVYFRTKIDTGKPATRRWDRTGSVDGTSYSYDGHDANDLFGRLVPPQQWLRELFAGRMLMIEFQPRGWQEKFVAEFNISDFKNAYDMNPECPVVKLKK